MISEYAYDEKRQVRLERMRELSVNVKSEEGLKLYLRDGTAEIFGRELPQYTMQQFLKGDRFTIFTWTGCTLWLEYHSHEDFFPITDESMYPIYANINQYLSELRGQAMDQRKVGPRVLICGANQSGKTTIAKTLMNYGCKQGWTPVLVDLDPLANAVMAGGCIGACVCKNFYPSNGGIEIKNKIVFYHGYSRIQMGLLKNQVETLGQAISKKLSSDLEAFKQKYSLDSSTAVNIAGVSQNSKGGISGQKQQQVQFMQQVGMAEKRLFASGCVINMPPMQSKEQKEMIDLIVKHFGIDVVVGLDDEVVNSLRQNLLLTNGYSVIRTSKPCGLKNKEETEQIEEARKINQKLYQNYFKGATNDIDCHSSEINLNELLVYRLKLSDKLQTMGGVGALAAGGQQQKKQFYEKVDLLKENVTKSIVGVLNLPRTALDKLKEDEVFEKISKSTLGMLFHLSDMRTNQQFARLFLPGLNMDSVIKQNVCIIGDITWFESSSDKKR